VEDLFGAKLAHCFGGVTADPVMRAAGVMIIREIHDEDCLGSTWYGDTISFSEDFDRNLGLNAEYLLWDMVAQLVCPTGHAMVPLDVVGGFAFNAQVEGEPLNRFLKLPERPPIQVCTFKSKTADYVN